MNVDQVRRGRGRPVLPRQSPEQLTDERLRVILTNAAQLNPYDLSLCLGRWEREGVHPSVLRLTLRLQRRGRAEAQAYVATLTRYLRVLGLLELGNGHG